MGSSVLAIMAIVLLAPATEAWTCRSYEVALVVDGVEVVDPAENAVRQMFDAFMRHSPDEYAGWMADDFNFSSNDSAFIARYPGGTSREDERRFARNLLQPPDPTVPARDRPHALTVDMSLGGIEVIESHTSGRATLVLDFMQVRLAMSDGSTLDLGATRHEFEVVRTAGGWRVRRWVEFRLVAGPVAAPAPAQPVPEDSAEPPILLALAQRVDRAGRVLSFNVSLPTAGGRLELFDVAGRRVDMRDLRDLPRGHHQVALNGAGRAAGIYWARLRQGEAAATARVVWVR